MALPKPKILVVDDERNVLLTVEAILQQEGYDVDAVSNGTAAIEAVRRAHYDLVLTDLKMPGVDGMAVLSEVQKRSPSTVTVMMTGYGSVDSALSAVQYGAYEYLLKPTEVEELKAAVRRSLERKRLSEIDTLYRISHTVTASLDPAAIAAEITEAVRSVLGVSGAQLLSLLPDLQAAREYPLGRCLTQEDIMARLESGEVLTSADHASCAEKWAAESGITSFAFVPGIVNDRLVCVLCAENGPVAYDFHPSACRFLQALAAQSAMALANAELVAELQKNNRELGQANRKLQELDQLKSQFLSVATHELRTPLSIILGYNSMLADSLHDRLSPEESATLRESMSACQRLIRLVNSMLDITQIESGKMRMNFTPTDLRQVISEVAALFQQQARDKDVKITVKLPSHLPRLSLDAERIEQVLINLIGNALKFTAKGGRIGLSVREVPGEVEVAVSDTGIGIEPDDLSRIFDEFSQVRRQLSQRQREGSGLGLAIARRITEAHEGTLRVTSTPGKGSTFYLNLPLCQVNGGTADTAVCA